jgi:ABC-type transport system substrate-binding protein
MARSAFAILVAVCRLSAGPADFLTVPAIAGRPGGALTYAQRGAPKTLNPVFLLDSASREIVQRITADLIHINRASRRTEPALAKSWSVSPDGLHYTLELRRGVSFSDGHPFDADDVVFSFQVYLDEKVSSPPARSSAARRQVRSDPQTGQPPGGFRPARSLRRGGASFRRLRDPPPAAAGADMA